MAAGWACASGREEGRGVSSVSTRTPTFVHDISALIVRTHAGAQTAAVVVQSEQIWSHGTVSMPNADSCRVSALHRCTGGVGSGAGEILRPLNRSVLVDIKAVLS